MSKNQSLTIAAVGAAVLSTILMQRYSSWRSELPAELVCWLVLPLLFRANGRGDLPKNKGEALLPENHGTDGTTSRWSLWAFAASIAMSSSFKDDGGMVKLYPALTPILLLGQECLASATQVPGAGIYRSMPAMNIIWGAAPIAVFSTLNLLYWDIRNAFPAIIPTAALLAVYSALLHGTGRRFVIPHVRLEEAVVPISIRITAFLGMAFAARTIIWGGLEVEIAPTVISGLLKALSWYTLAKTARYSSWCIATTVGTFAIASTRNSFVQSSEIQAVAHIATSLLALGQTIHFLPRQLRGSRYALWTFALLPLIPYVANSLAIWEAQSSVVAKDHPVEVFNVNAKLEFEHLVDRQSKSYAAAHREYLRRYSVEPPPGFRAWYEFAESRESPIIDDFDMILEGVAPFWELSGSEVREVMDKALHAKGNELWACSTTNTSCSHQHRSDDRNFSLLFNTLLKDIRNTLPAVDYVINHFDEPAVLNPPKSAKEEKERGKFKARNFGKRVLWPEITKYCQSPTSENTTAPETFGLPFLTDVSSSKNLCLHSEYYETHGLLARPNSAQFIEGSVPVLSMGSLSTMGDLVFPSPAYIEDGFRYDPAQDVEWEEKRNNLYWAGSTTGGYAGDGQWRLYQRQRFVELAQNLVSRPHVYLREVGGVVTRVASSFLNSRLFDAAFTRVSQCKKKYCREQQDYFRMKGWAHKDEALRSRLVFDIDGNGISGRFYKLLASRSTPLKMTIIQEWHDERLVPWVHYVPVSVGMEELPELVMYLTSTEEGQERARDIAEAGRRWYFQALRENDMAVYVYRLLLELARLQDPEREAGHPRPAAL